MLVHLLTAAIPLWAASLVFFAGAVVGAAICNALSSVSDPSRIPWPPVSSPGESSLWSYEPRSRAFPAGRWVKSGPVGPPPRTGSAIGRARQWPDPPPAGPGTHIPPSRSHAPGDDPNPSSQGSRIHPSPNYPRGDSEPGPPNGIPIGRQPTPPLDFPADYSPRGTRSRRVATPRPVPETLDPLTPEEQAVFDTVPRAWREVVARMSARSRSRFLTTWKEIHTDGS